MFCVSHSTALLLAAAGSLLSSVLSAESATTCGSRSNVHQLTCDLGVISVESALYGRADTQTCSEGKRDSELANTQCSLAGTVDTIRKRCNGKKVCELNSEDVQTSDPCEGISKYLQTNYTCLPALQNIACEDSLAHLFCHDGQVIFVYGADYGRRDMTTCAYRRPPNQVRSVDCINPTDIVADRCNGKTTCTIRATNSIFGDPCVGTYKYLEVSYHCEYPLSF